MAATLILLTLGAIVLGMKRMDQDPVMVRATPPRFKYEDMTRVLVNLSENFENPYKNRSSGFRGERVRTQMAARAGDVTAKERLINSGFVRRSGIASRTPLPNEFHARSGRTLFSQAAR